MLSSPGRRAFATRALLVRTLLAGTLRVSRLSEAAHLKNVHAEGLEPGQQPLQRRDIGKLAIQHGLDRLYGRAEVLKIEQRLGRKNPGNADLIMRWCHSGPPSWSEWAKIT